MITYTTGEAAKLCGISQQAIIRCFDSGQLAGKTCVGNAAHPQPRRPRLAQDPFQRIEIIEGRQLKSMLLEHLGLDALIGLPTLPPNWQRHDIS